MRYRKQLKHRDALVIAVNLASANICDFLMPHPHRNHALRR
jgi:hypothetical protein